MGSLFQRQMILDGTPFPARNDTRQGCGTMEDMGMRFSPFHALSLAEIRALVAGAGPLDLDPALREPVAGGRGARAARCRALSGPRRANRRFRVVMPPVVPEHPESSGVADAVQANPGVDAKRNHFADIVLPQLRQPLPRPLRQHVHFYGMAVVAAAAPARAPVDFRPGHALERAQSGPDELRQTVRAALGQSPRAVPVEDGDSPDDGLIVRCGGR